LNTNQIKGFENSRVRKCVNEYMKTKDYYESPKKSKGFVEYISKSSTYSVKSTSRAFEYIENTFYEMLPRSLASKAMTKLLNWRNGDTFDASESKTRSVANKILFGVKVLTLEIAQPLVAVCAAVETVAYGVFTLGEYALGLECTKTHVLKSSVFTLFWAPSVFCYYNLFCSKPKSNEYLVREDLNELKDSIANGLSELISDPS
jgi:hypothetical protein